MSHEERREREKPTRTLFIRNIPYEANQTELNDVFAAYGKIARFYNLVPKRGMAFVTYVRSQTSWTFRTEPLSVALAASLPHLRYAPRYSTLSLITPFNLFHHAC